MPSVYDDDMEVPLNDTGGTGLAQTGAYAGSYLTQVYATIRRQIIQKRRAPLACLLELLLPVFFAGLLAYVSTLADLTEFPASQFVTNDVPPSNLSTMLWSSMCYRGTKDSYLAETLGSCDRIPGVSISKICNSGQRGETVPMDVCLLLPDVVAPVIRSVAVYADNMHVLDFDSYLLLQWAVHLRYGEGSSNIFANAHGLNSLRVGGKLIFVPQTPFVKNLVSHLNETNKLFRYSFGQFADSRDAVLPMITSIAGEGKTWAVIEADHNSDADVSFIISVNRTAVPATRVIRLPFSKGLGNHPYANYFACGFLTLQHTLSQYYLKFLNTSLLPTENEGYTESISVAPMGFATYVDNSFFAVAGRTAPLVQVLSFLYTVSQLSKRLVEEKEQRLREGTMIMGLTRAAFFSSWILVYYAQIFLTTIITTAILSKWLLTKTVFIVTFFLYFLFGINIVNMAALLSCFFNKSRIAALVIPLLYFMMSIPSFALPEGTDPGVYVLLSWIPTMPFSIGNVLLFNYETTVGMDTANVANPNDNSPYNMASCYAMLGLACIFTPMVMLYLDSVLPKEWGSRKHPCFCVCWCCRRKTSYADEDADNGEQPNEVGSPLKYMKGNPTAVDEYPDVNANTSIHVRNVRKTFDTPSGTKVAVDDINLRMFPGMITVLLGHNGAGKTTLMNMMTGMLDMTEGDVTVYDVSVRTNLNDVRRNVGYCPQHNILWDDLTCIEHLEYFARLKGVRSDKIQSEAIRLLTRVDLLDKKNVFSCNLSGGQKRKLSVAIAFIGGSQLILLDEPTAGMDVTARRHTWEIIRELSAGRTILLTTHFMDEADLLGSRIAIMSKGRLHSYGAPMFLKNALGSGYVLRVSATKTITDQGCEALLKEAAAIIPTVALREVKGQEVAFVLNKSEAERFPAILRHFESEKIKQQYNLSGVSMTVSTLEDVFLRIAEEEEVEEITTPTTATNEPSSAGKSKKKDDHHGPSEEEIAKAFATLEESYQSSQQNPSGGNMQQLWGLLVKRFHYARRDNRTICFQLAMPLLSLLLAMVLSYLNLPDQPMLWLDANMFGNDRQLSTFNNGTAGLEDVYANDGYLTQNTALNSTYNFSNYLLDTYMDSGKMERFTSVSRRDDSFNGSWGPHVYTTLFTNATAPHSAPVSMQAYYQNVAREQLNRTDPSDGVRLRVAVFPLPYTERQDDQIDAVKRLLVALFVLIPFTFIPSTYVAYVVKERQCKAKHLQFVSGVQYSIYWISNFIFDFLAYTVTAAASVSIFFIFKRDEFIGTVPTAFATISVLMLYGISGIFAAYSISFFFDSHSTAQNIVMIVNFVIGFCLVMASFIMGQMDSTKDTMVWLVYVFRTFPAFCLGEGIMNIAITSSTNTILGRHKSLYSMDVVGADLAFMGGASFVFLLLTVIIDHPRRKEKQRMLGFDASKVAPMPLDEDDDVAEERAAIELQAGALNDNRADDVIRVKGLRKVYSLGLGKEKVAVQNITFGVKQGEVFGFLGTNGAGKTTTMSVLTGEFVPTMGEAQVCGFDVVRQAKEAFKVIGYCPQFDAVLDLLTPTEHLKLYASLRGIPSGKISAVVNALILVCGLDEFRSIPAMRLSGGNKRKLSVAIALVGSPKLVFLDEPSAGMDPHARRGMWDVIVFIAKRSSVLLTTHHLEEVDVLAHRVGIMDQGLMKCLGSLEHLKRKFGSGFELTIRLSHHSKEMNALAFVQSHFAGSTLVESREQRLVFALPANSTSLADLFEDVQKAQKDESLGITDYIVQQTSLENVFMKITAEAATNENGDTMETSNINNKSGAQRFAVGGEGGGSCNNSSSVLMPEYQATGQGYASMLKGSGGGAK